MKSLVPPVAQGHPQRVDDMAGNVVLDFKQVGEITVETLGPQMRAVGGVDQLRGDPDAIAGTSDGAFQYIARSEGAAYLPQIDCLALVGKAGVARDHHQPGDLRQVGDDVLADTVGKILLFRVARPVLEREYGD